MDRKLSWSMEDKLLPQYSDIYKQSNRVRVPAGHDIRLTYDHIRSCKPHTRTCAPLYLTLYEY